MFLTEFDNEDDVVAYSVFAKVCLPEQIGFTCEIKQNIQNKAKYWFKFICERWLDTSERLLSWQAWLWNCVSNNL